MSQQQASERPTTEQALKDAADHDELTPAEQAVVNQEEALVSGEENAV